MGEVKYNKQTGQAIRLENSQWVDTPVKHNKQTGESIAFDGQGWAAVGGGGGTAPQPAPQDQSQQGYDPSFLGGITDAVTGGLTFGLRDEMAGLAAGIVDPANFGDAYKRGSAEKRAQMGKFSEAYPKSAFSAEMLGAVVNPATAGAGRLVSGAKGMLGRAGVSSATGAGIGGVYGAGSAEPGKRTSGAVEGAALGGALGGAAVPLIEGGIAVGRNVIQLLMSKFGGNTSAAQQKMAQVAAKIGDGDLQIGLQRLQQRLDEAGPDAVLADVTGIAGQKMARAAANIPGEGAKIADEFIGARVAGRGERLQTASDKLAQRRNMAVLEEKRGVAKTMASSPHYEAAYAANPTIVSKEIDLILKTPDGKKALLNAVKMMQNDRSFVGKIKPELTKLLKDAVALGKMPDVLGGVAEGLNLRTLDYVKRALYDIENKLARKGETTAAGITGGQRRSLTAELDKLDVTAGKGKLGEYAQGRANYAAIAKEKEAVDAGLSFIKGDSDFTTQMLSRLSQGEKESFRLGARKALSDLINVDTQSAINKFANKKAGFWGKLKAVFPDDQSFKAFQSDIGRELKMAQTEGFVGPRANSHTTGLQQDIAELSRAPSAVLDAAEMAATRRPIQAAGRLAMAPINYMRRPATGTARDLASMLMEMDPAKQTALLRQMGGLRVAGSTFPAISAQSGRNLAQLLARGGGPMGGMAQGQ